MRTRNVIIASLTAALLVGAAVPASFAAPGRGGHDGPRGHGMMKEIMFVRLLKTADTDKDAKVTKEEVSARQEALFAEIDTDKDGNLTPGELRIFRETKVEEFRKANPRPDRAERRKERAESDQQTAENGDNEAAGGEIQDRRDGRRHEGRRHGMHHGPRMSGHMGGFHLLRRADTDENGQFSKAEVAAAVDKLFTRMDTNGDGVITIDDMPNRPF